MAYPGQPQSTWTVKACSRCGCWNANCRCAGRVGPASTAIFRPHDRVKYIGTDSVLDKKKKYTVAFGGNTCIQLFGKKYLKGCWPKEDFELLEARADTVRIEGNNNRAIRGIKKSQLRLKANLLSCWADYKNDLKWYLRLMEANKKILYMSQLPPRAKELLNQGLETNNDELLVDLLRQFLVADKEEHATEER